MRKTKKRDRDQAIALSQEESRVHRAKQERPHIALEYVEHNQRDVAESLTVHLRPWARNSAHGTARKVVVNGTARWEGIFQHPGMPATGYYPTNVRTGMKEQI